MLSSCKHILVDEFQVTSGLLYKALLTDSAGYQHHAVRTHEVLRQGAQRRERGGRSRSVHLRLEIGRCAELGQDDQRFAVPGRKLPPLMMIIDFPGAQAIYLEENYRSTGSILAAAHSIVAQGKHHSAIVMP